MKIKPSHSVCSRIGIGIGAGIILSFMTAFTSLAYTNYTGCMPCHDDFRGSFSTKGTVFPGNNHDMHRSSSSMGTACNLCHIGSSRTPVLIGISAGTANNPGLGCTGCHVGSGLRAHHASHGIDCYGCHAPETAPPEGTKPPYYGTADTKARNPGNPVQVANTNENWSVGDFLGIDNDGNNLYDLADYAVGPFRLLGITTESQNVIVTWLTARGRTNLVQAASALSVSGSFANISAPITSPGVGLITNAFVDVGGVTNKSRFYRVAGGR